MAVLLTSLWSAVSAQDYSVNYTGTKSRRQMTSVTLISPSKGSQSVSLPGTNLYDDKTSTTFTVAAGEELTAQFGYTAGWMHGYVYIDWDSDGFTASIDSDGYTPIGDLMTYSFYAGSETGNSDATGKNSVGTVLTGGARSVCNPPAFTCPDRPGTYRMRFKLDWSSINPAGSTNLSTAGGMGTLEENAGQIVDVTLVVEAASSLADVTYIYTLDGTEITRKTQSATIGGLMPAYITPPSYVNVSTDLPASVPEGGGTYTIATTTNAASPFKFSKTLDAAKWVTMKLLFSKKNNNDGEAKPYAEGTWIGANGSSTVLAYDEPTAENFANYMWAFVGDWHNGYKVYSFANQSMKLAYTGNFTTSNDVNRTIVMATEETAQNTWQLENWTGTDGVGYSAPTYALRLVNTSHPNYYAGDHIGARVLGTWESTGGNSAHHGRIAFADPLPIYTQYAQTVFADAGKVGYPKTTSIGATQLGDALTNATSFSELYGYVENFRSENDVVLPTDGKAYTLKAHFTGSNKYVALGEEKLTTNETEGAPFICHEVSPGKFVFVNNKGSFFNKVGNLTEYSDWTEFTLLHSYGDVDATYGTFCLMDKDTKKLTTNGATFNQGNEDITETSTTAFYLEETTYANNPTMTVAKGVDEEKKIATFSAPFAFTLPAGIDAYIVKQAPTGETATLELLASAGDVVAANTGVILLGETDATKVLMVPATTKGVSDAASLLGHSAGAPVDVVTAGTNYILAKNGDGNIVFSKASVGADSNKNLSMNKAYLKLGGLGVNQFKLDFGGTTTAIEGITTEADAANAPVYDLSGRRIAAPAHRGIYIRNGKKFMVK